MISYVWNGLVTNINLNKNTNEKEVVQMKGDVIHSGYLKGMGFYK
jgi:hypothetical protein